MNFNLFVTRKYSLRGYILGVLTHTTALDQLWGGDETLTMALIKYMHLGFASEAAVPLGSEGDPGCIFFTYDTYQATSISDNL